MLLRAVVRFLRTVLAVGAGAGITWAIGHTGDLPVQPEIAVLIGAVLVALDKYARDRGWYSVGV
jgi:uncharacterized membrane protein YccC